MRDELRAARRLALGPPVGMKRDSARLRCNKSAWCRHDLECPWYKTSQWNASYQRVRTWDGENYHRHRSRAALARAHLRNSDHLLSAGRRCECGSNCPGVSPERQANFENAFHAAVVRQSVPYPHSATTNGVALPDLIFDSAQKSFDILFRSDTVKPMRRLAK